MSPGDLVHVVADNSYHGVGLTIMSTRTSRTPGGQSVIFYVLLNGKLFSLFPSELELIDEK